MKGVIEIKSIMGLLTIWGRRFSGFSSSCHGSVIRSSSMILKVVKIDTHLLFRVKGVYPKPYICVYIYTYIYMYIYICICIP